MFERIRRAWRFFRNCMQAFQWGGEITRNVARKERARIRLEPMHRRMGGVSLDAALHATVKAQHNERMIRLHALAREKVADANRYK